VSRYHSHRLRVPVKPASTFPSSDGWCLRAAPYLGSWTEAHTYSGGPGPILSVA
jgi:hypothetical protein